MIITGSAEAPADPVDQRIARAFGRTRHCCCAGTRGIKGLLAIVADDGDTRSPVDALAGLLVLAAQLQAVQSLIRSMEKRSNEASNRLETIPGIGFWARPPSRPSSPNRKHSSRVVILRPGSGSCRGKIRPAANRSLGRSQTGRPIPQAHPYCRRSFCLAASAPAAREISLAHSASRAATVQGHRGRAGQQDGADRLGVAGQGWDLPGAPTRGSLTRSSAMGG